MLRNKVAIITGASSGIGRAAAKLFAEEGAAVVVNARGREALEALVAEIEKNGGRAAAVCGDVADETTHRQLVETAIHRFGGLDIAFNNAGTAGPFKSLTELTPGEWQHFVAANLGGAVLAAMAQIPAMLSRGGGSIIFTSTFVGTSVGIPGMCAYGTAKAGLMGLVKGITADYAAQGIRRTRFCRGEPIRPWRAMPRRRNGPRVCMR